MDANEKKDFDAMRGDLNSVRSDVGEIKTALLGDEYRRDGIIPEVKRMRKELDDLNDFKKKVLWLVTVCSIVFGIIFQLLRNVIK